MGLGSSPRLSRAGWILFLAFLLAGFATARGWARPLASALWQLGPIQDGGETRLLIRVQDGRMVRMDAQGRDRTLRATTIAMQEARPPDSAELNLAPWEDRLLPIEGRDSGGWLYSSRIARALTPIEEPLARWVWSARSWSTSP